MRLVVSILICLSASCNNSHIPAIGSSRSQNEKVKMVYYKPDFTFDTNSRLKLNGYYQVREIFGSFTTNGKDYQTNKPTFGYLQFFPDGFCKVGWWNVFFHRRKK